MPGSLISIQSTPIPTQLAAWIAEKFDREQKRRDKGYAGTCAAMVQQIHYYMSQQFGSIPHQVKETLIDGRRWIFKSYSSWQQTFPWLTDYAFRKVRSLLMELGLIEVEQLGLRQQGRDRTCWYTVNYDHPFLQQLLSTDAQPDSSTDASGSNSTNATAPSSTTPFVDCQRIPITTSNTTGNTLSEAANQKEKKVETHSSTTVDSSVSSTANSDWTRPKPKNPHEDKSSEAGGVRTRSDTLAASAAVEPWEVAPNHPYPYFLQWRALHYKTQGGHWANSPQANAYAEFYKNRFKTHILWQEFLQFYNLALDNALALQGAGIEVKLPSCFEERTQVNEQEVVRKAETLTQTTAEPKRAIEPCADFSFRISQLVKQHTLPQGKPSKQPCERTAMYLSWLHGDEPVLVEEARKKLAPLMMERDDLFPVWDEQGRLIDVEIGQTQLKQR